jgi:hypothetical protein
MNQLNLLISIQNYYTTSAAAGLHQIENKFQIASKPHKKNP